MIMVIFELIPLPGRKLEYLDIAAQLLPSLQQVDGFISIERFQSLTDQNKILSLSVFRDEKAVRDWRTFEAHRAAQNKGCNDIFSNYRLRVTSVIRDYGMDDRAQAPGD